MRIKILNWDKFNPKRDQKTYSWLRLQNGIASDPKLFGLTAEQKWIWVCLLCEASKDNSGEIQVEIPWLVDTTKVKRAVVETTLMEFEKRLMISKALPPADAHYTKLPLRTYERTDERTNVVSGETSFEVVTELLPLKDFFEGRKISPKLQRLWLDSYSADFIIQKVKALKIWEANAGAKGRKSNWGKFYSNCFARDWDDWTKKLPGGKGAPKKSLFAETMEAELLKAAK